MRGTTAGSPVHGHFTNREAKVWAAERHPAPRPHPIAVLVASPCRLRDGCWKDLSLAIRGLPRRPSPRLIVMTSRADDRLWAEVADLGAAGVLSKPLVSDDVTWTLTDCWQDWRREAELCRARSAATPASATM